MLNKDLNGKLEMFNLMHIITLVVLLTIMLLFYFYREKISNDKFEKRFRISIGLFLIIFETLFHIWRYTNGEYSRSMIPLTGFCATTNLTTAILLLTNKTKYFKYVIYYALTGATFSLIFVNTAYGFPHFRYFHYFLNHFGFLMASLYYYFTNKIEVSKKSFINASLILFGYTVFILILDLLLNENWFFLFENPVIEISNFFGKPWYTILWMMFNVLLNYFWFLLIKRRGKLVNG